MGRAVQALAKGTVSLRAPGGKLALLAALAVLGCSTTRASSPGDPAEDGGGLDSTVLGDADASSDADGAPLCGPADVAAFAPIWDPPVGPHEGACSEAQLVGLIRACFAAFATPANCTAWEEEPANQGCLGCWSGPETATRWAPYLYVNNPGETDYVNIAGCVALADPGQVACAKALEAALQCELAACLGPCPVPNNATPDEAQVAMESLDDCYDRSDQGGCMALVEQGTQCSLPLEDAGPAAFCFDTGRDTSALLQFFALACAGGPKDGGAD